MSIVAPPVDNPFARYPELCCSRQYVTPSGNCYCTRATMPSGGREACTNASRVLLRRLDRAGKY